MDIVKHITHSEIKHAGIFGELTKNHQLAIMVPHEVVRKGFTNIESECPIYVEVPGFDESSARARGSSIVDDSDNTITVYVTNISSRPGAKRIRVLYNGRIVNQGVIIL